MKKEYSPYFVSVPGVLGLENKVIHTWSVCCGKLTKEVEEGIFQCEVCGRTWVRDREGQIFLMNRGSRPESASRL